MKRPVISLIVFVFIVLSVAGTALAGSAPTAMSYFTNPNYNKTYTGDDGLQHTMSVTWVGETWNKIGTVIYNINYNDTYVKDGDTYIDVKGSTEIYENAKPTYPDSPNYRVYRINWYADGHTEVLYDYRPASTPAPTPVPRLTPTENPTISPVTDPTTAPTVKPNAKQTQKPTAKPTVTQTATPATTEDPASTLTTLPTETPTTTPTPMLIVSPNSTPSLSPTTTVASAVALVVTDVPASAVPVIYEWPAQSERNLNTPWVMWGWIIIVVLGIGVVLLLILFVKNRKGNKKR